MNVISETPAEGTARPLSKTEKLMVRAMNAAWEAPMFAIVADIDMTAAQARRSEGVTLTDVILADCAATLAEHPAINAHYREEAVVQFAQVNIGLAVASDRGLTVPVIHGAEGMSLTEIAARRAEIVAKVRAGKIAISDVMGGTFTVSNLGMLGVRQFTAIINPPQAAILAVGSTEMRQVWNGGDPQWRPMSSFSLTCDHRATDGAHAARFLAALKARLETPAIPA
ncbi:MAG: 2-oxo acid dehydrogenase subunit E2 [Fuscovulum sp.]|jgi:pyruvate dehydrogenase E2 component (dihydrolipoamide acetyltransferase)|nr:2-oxo acid dehydrogenase subunit E2 [Fuscovulum sp.]